MYLVGTYKYARDGVPVKVEKRYDREQGNEKAGEGEDGGQG
jgi:hypothetical protein